MTPTAPILLVLIGSALLALPKCVRGDDIEPETPTSASEIQATRAGPETHVRPGVT